MPETEVLNLCAQNKYPEVVLTQFPNQFFHAASLLRKDLTEKISTKQFSEILMTYTAWP
jgi:hypothetical protein